jgi:calcium-dependent protein kinase
MGNCCKPDQHLTHTLNNKHPEQHVSPYARPVSLQISTAPADISHYFVFDKVIGKGHFGIVRSGYLRQDKSIEVAIKSLHKKNVGYDVLKLRREIEILKYADHPNIIKFYDCYEDQEYLHIVTELCSGGELFTKIISKGCFLEDEAKKLVYKMFKVINYLHCKGIIHRDIKPENFLFEDKEEDAEFKLIDFGLSNMVSDGSDQIKERRIIGSPLYIAPEALKGEYGFECDVWSLGVILFALLSGKVPFPGRTANEIFDLIKKCEYRLTGPIWDNISESAKDLISRILIKDPHERITTLQVLNHPWLTEAKLAIDQQIDTEVIDTLKCFKPISKIRYEGISEYVKYLNIPQLRFIRTTFLALDTEHTGKLRPEVLKETLKSLNISFSKHRISKILKYTSYLSQEYMTYTNFLCAVVSQSDVSINNSIIQHVFQQIDSDLCGKITPEDLIEYMRRKGISIPVTQAQEMILEVTQNEPAISYEEFEDHILCINLKNVN